MTRRFSLRLLSIAAGLLLFPSLGFSFDAVAEKNERDRAILRELGVDPTPKGALQYLESLLPTGDPYAAIDALILQLGDPQFARREQAIAKLLSLPTLPRAKLEAATRSDDAEIRWRAHAVLARLGIAGNRALLAALRQIADDPPAGSAQVLVGLASSEPLESHQLALHESLRQSARESDLPYLEQASRAGTNSSRLAAAYALERLSPDKGRHALAELLVASEPRVALQAAKYLGNVGDRRCLASLADLLGNDDPLIAEESANFLTSLSGQDFSFSHHGDAASRQKAREAVLRWIRTAGATAKLNFPVSDPVIRRGDLAGNTLIATGGIGRVVELDPAGKEVWRYDVNAWSAEKLTNGNVLIASYQSNLVLEVNPYGTVVWSKEGINAMRAKPLAASHVLVADFGGQRVLELNEDHEIVWQTKTPDNCFDVERLPNGNTVYACPNLVREVDREGETVRTLSVEGRINSVQVLPNGHWLVANFQRDTVEQYDREGKLVWKFSEPGPCDAFRLRNGKTLIATSRRAIEVSADGSDVQEVLETRYGCMRR
jgi:HEAT repeat protein